MTAPAATTVDLRAGQHPRLPAGPAEQHHTTRCDPFSGRQRKSGGGGPLPTAANSRVGELAPEHRRAEAFGWYTSAATAGAAVAAPLSGALLDATGPAAAAAVAAGFAVGAVCLVAHRSLRESLSAQSAEHTAAT
ncbi:MULTISPECIES: MFS transporter [unclassified Saccharopolyspora]|uniref:MFS transporter n=1 Tax=Saccharopolyspora TaxID=1835 RepID=UPI00190BD312|nr:MFS transporter [Saccharopolyspora sp. HNM0986]MBK0865880.1 hypothetical protein [Saccharopolyspora sp. HNM0986]